MVPSACSVGVLRSACAVGMLAWLRYCLRVTLVHEGLRGADPRCKRLPPASTVAAHANGYLLPCAP